MSEGPFEPGEGQDETPDVDTAIHATIVMLRDTIDFFEERDPENDLRIRLAALRRALVRLRERREERTVDGRSPVPDGAVD